MSLEDIVVKSAADPKGKGVFNQAGQCWHHDFYWKVLTPGGGRHPTGKLAAALDRDFGGFDKFKQAFAARANAVFGSGHSAVAVRLAGYEEMRRRRNEPCRTYESLVDEVHS
jgi:Fe-Mn family superoxide dismutase